MNETTMSDYWQDKEALLLHEFPWKYVHKLFVLKLLDTRRFFYITAMRLWDWYNLKQKPTRKRTKKEKKRLRRLLEVASFIRDLTEQENWSTGVRSCFNVPAEELEDFDYWYKTHWHETLDPENMLGLQRGGVVDTWLQQMGFTGFHPNPVREGKPGQEEEQEQQPPAIKQYFTVKLQHDDSRSTVVPVVHNSFWALDGALQDKWDLPSLYCYETILH